MSAETTTSWEEEVVLMSFGRGSEKENKKGQGPRVGGGR